MDKFKAAAQSIAPVPWSYHANDHHGIVFEQLQSLAVECSPLTSLIVLARNGSVTMHGS